MALRCNKLQPIKRPELFGLRGRPSYSLLSLKFYLFSHLLLLGMGRKKRYKKKIPGSLTPFSRQTTLIPVQTQPAGTCCLRRSRHGGAAANGRTAAGGHPWFPFCRWESLRIGGSPSRPILDEARLDSPGKALANAPVSGVFPREPAGARDHRDRPLLGRKGKPQRCCCCVGSVRRERRGGGGVGACSSEGQRRDGWSRVGGVE